MLTARSICPAESRSAEMLCSARICSKRLPLFQRERLHLCEAQSNRNGFPVPFQVLTTSLNLYAAMSATNGLLGSTNEWPQRCSVKSGFVVIDQLVFIARFF